MTFHGKPSGGPDAVGGLFPRSEIQPFRSRAGAALVQGAVVTLDLTASATEISNVDSNSGLPGAGDATDDSIWNTVVDPVAATHIGTGANGPTGPALFGVVLPAAGIADNAIGKVQIHGIVDQARVISTGITNMNYGAPLTVTITNSLNVAITSNQRVVAFYAGPDVANLSATAVLRRVMLHNGVGFQGVNTVVA